MTALEARIAAAIELIDEQVTEVEDELQSPYLFSAARDALEDKRAALLEVRGRLD